MAASSQEDCLLFSQVLIHPNVFPVSAVVFLFLREVPSSFSLRTQKEFPQGHLAFGVVDENSYSSVSNQDLFSLAALRNFFFILHVLKFQPDVSGQKSFLPLFSFLRPLPFCSVFVF